jgi:protein-S-isoprenylcysteine O-methyltransferase Ste14
MQAKAPMVVQLLISTLGMLVVMGAALFASAGSLDWPGAWAFLVEMGVSSVWLGLWLARDDPALLAQRLGSPVAKAQSPWDRVFMVGAVTLFLAWMVFMGLSWRSSHRPDVAAWVQGAGFALIAACMVVGFLTFRANSFAAPVVKLQSDQTVATGGPYRYVRHPMYAGALLYFLGVPLLLGEWRGLVLTPFLVVGLAARAVGEERVLRAGLAGYADYASRVRYRFVPLVW